MVEIDELRKVMRDTMMYIRKNMRIFSDLAVILMEEMSREDRVVGLVREVAGHLMILVCYFRSIVFSLFG